jgi:hypothetical protein
MHPKHHMAKTHIQLAVAMAEKVMTHATSRLLSAAGEHSSKQQEIVAAMRQSLRQMYNVDKACEEHVNTYVRPVTRTFGLPMDSCQKHFAFISLSCLHVAD